MRFDVPIAAPGEAAAMDLVAAIAAADAVVGQPVPGEVIAGAIAAWRPPAGRAVTIEVEGGVLVIDDTYNANPGSMRAAFEALVELRRNRGGRAIAVLGEMRELGPLSTHEHHALGEVLAHLGVDLVIGCGGAIDVTARRAEQGGVPVRLAPSAEEAGRIAAGEARAGDVVLFKGSRGAAVERALGAFTSRFHPLASRAQGLP
jgi:UDP-N-acetylmuramoyl-tripeptide--D-alanyl-D-alanine ligase